MKAGPIVGDRVESGPASVERGLRLLRAFRGERTPLANAELARRTGLPKATVNRFTNTLVDIGCVSRQPRSRKYQLDAGAAAIGHSYLAHNALLAAARPILQALADRLQVSVALVLPDGLDALYLGYHAGPQVKTLRMGVGTLVPLATTALGHACLWGLPAPERESKVAAVLEACEGGPGRRERLSSAIRASFAELDASGLCWAYGLFQREVYGLARPVRVGPARRLLGLGCGKADAHADAGAERRRIGPWLHEAAERLEAQLADCARDL